MRLLACGLLLATGATSLATAAEPVRLDAHVAVYDLSLASADEEARIVSAVGRIALEVLGDPCEGFVTRVRQVIVLGTGEGAPQTIDTNSATFEAGDGSLLKFRSETRAAGMTVESVDGQAQRTDGAIAISLGRDPEPARVVEGGALFPTEHVRAMIARARDGERLMPARLFDGSDDGTSLYETLAIIGERRAPDSTLDSGPLAALADLASWPVRLSYFEEGHGDMLPDYTISFRLFENGVSSDLLFDFGSYTLEGRLVSLDLIGGAHDCGTASRPK